MKNPDCTEAVFFRYIRSTDDWFTDSKSNLGGMTFAFKLDYTLRKISVGVSVCASDENFCKQTGREIATRRLEQDPYVFGLDYFYNNGNNNSTLVRLINLLSESADIVGNTGLRKNILHIL